MKKKEDLSRSFLKIDRGKLGDVLGDVAQSIQISSRVSSSPIAIADVLKRNLIILNHVPTVNQQHLFQC